MKAKGKAIAAPTAVPTTAISTVSIERSSQSGKF
jgi:hypothetical protein